MRKPRAPHASANLTKSIGCSSTPYSGLPRKTICSHLIWPSVLFLMMTTLTGSLYFTPVRKLGHQHREAAVADEGDALPVGIRDLRARWRTASRSPSSPGCRSSEKHLAAPDLGSGAPPGGDRAAIGGDDRVVAQRAGPAPRRPPAASSACPSRVPRSSISFRQSRMPLLRLLEEARGPRCAAAAAAAPRSVARLSPTRPTSTGIAQADAQRVDVDLHAARLARLRVGTRCTETTCRPSAACRTPPALPATARVPSRPMPPVVYGLSSGTQPLPSSGLTIGAPSSSAACSSSSVASSAPWPARMTDLLRRVQDLGRLTQTRLVGDQRAARRRIRRVVRLVALRRARSLSISWMSAGNVRWATPR